MKTLEKSTNRFGALSSDWTCLRLYALKMVRLGNSCLKLHSGSWYCSAACGGSISLRKHEPHKLKRRCVTNGTLSTSSTWQWKDHNLNYSVGCSILITSWQWCRESLTRSEMQQRISWSTLRIAAKFGSRKVCSYSSICIQCLAILISICPCHLSW